MSVAEIGIVDSHHHLWDLSQRRHPWLVEGPFPDRGWGDWADLRRDYLLADFLADASGQELRKSVHVQANWDHSDPVGETRWLQGIADRHGFPHGIVAYADLSRPEAERIVAAHCEFANVRGVRQVLNRHPDPAHNRAEHDYLDDENWARRLGLLQARGLSFDVQVYAHQMPRVAELARRYPDLPFIICHAGMPISEDDGGHAGWRRGVRLLGACPNVSIKITGFGMVDGAWTQDSIAPFVDTIVDAFGPGRCMFGSNFPVDKLMSSYDRLWNSFRSIAARWSAHEQRAVLHDTAIRVYRL